MNENIYPKTGAYRAVFQTSDLFFEEVRLTYGAQFCKEIKREAFKDYSVAQNLTKVEESDLLNRVKLRHPELRSCQTATGLIGVAA